jgi:hypothetical protein
MPFGTGLISMVRDRTARLVRLGCLMNGGYRRLLLHPYRGRT